MAARRFEYPDGVQTAGQRKKFRRKELDEHKDVLYYNEYRTTKRASLVFRSNDEEGWMAVIMELHQDLTRLEQRTKKSPIRLKGKFTTVCFYAETLFLVYSKQEPDMLEWFEKNFERMQMARLFTKLPEIAD